jgi:hypothetical protein
MLVNRENHEIDLVTFWDTFYDRLAPERSGFIDQQIAKLTWRNLGASIAAALVRAGEVAKEA